MTYTINGEQYTEFDIKKRCAELMGIDVFSVGEQYILYEMASKYIYNPCVNPFDTWPIIEKCWDELMRVPEEFDGVSWVQHGTVWDLIMKKHNCNALTAACIFYIESNGND